MGKQETIKAMKGNLPGEFSQMAWDIGNPERHGWRKIGVKSKAVEVEAEKIPIVKTEVKVEEVVVEKPKVPDGDILYPTDAEIKVVLKDKGVKFHQALGTKKLRKLYEDSK